MINLIKRLFKINRYFIVSYIGSNSHISATGSCEVINNKGRFLNQKTIENVLAKNHNFNTVVFTNIIEISQRDYSDYIFKYKDTDDKNKDDDKVGL